MLENCPNLDRVLCLLEIGKKKFFEKSPSIQMDGEREGL